MKDKNPMVEIDTEKILRIVPDMLEISSQIWMDYDAGADVLYINFKSPAHADESIMSEDDVVYRYEKKKLVGITILHAKERAERREQ